MTDDLPEWISRTDSEELCWRGHVAWRAIAPKLLIGVSLVGVGFVAQMGLLEFPTPENIAAKISVFTSADTPIALSVEWLSVLPVGLLLFGVFYTGRALYPRFATAYAITDQRVVVRRRFASDNERVPLDSIEEFDWQRSILGQIFGYGDLILVTTGDTAHQPVLSGVGDLDEVSTTFHDLDRGASPLRLQREYIRVTPAHDELQVDDVIRHVNGLNNVESGARDQGFARFLSVGDATLPTFEFLILTEGDDAPVEFYYSAVEQLSVLEQHLETAYPEAFDIERVRMDVATKLVSPIEYAPEEFQTALDRGELQCTPHQVSSLKISRESGSVQPQRADGGTGITESVDEGDSSASIQLNDSDDTSSRDRPRRSSSLQTPQVTDAGVVARPSLESNNVTVRGVEWRGDGDWMTPLARFDEHLSQPGSDERANAPLTPLIDQLAGAEQPTVFQTVFQPRPDWSQTAYSRKHDIQRGRDGLAETILDAFSKMLWGYEDYQDQTVPHDEQHVTAIDEKRPRCTFTTNLRLCTISTTATADAPSIDRRLDTLTTVFDHLDGPYYTVEGQRLRSNGIRKTTAKRHARRTFHRLLNRALVTSRRWRLPGRPTSELVCNAGELANFITVPDAEQLSVEGARRTRAEQQSRNPLPRPHQDLMDEFRDGMAIGYALGENGDPEDVPTHIPPGVLPTHYGRFGTTGSGKSNALINDMLSLYDNTQGPTVLIVPKDDDMAQHYMRAHARRFGMTDLEENVIHFPIPEVLPGFSFFDLEPAMENGRRRADAVQRTADHYEEILKLVMGTDRYERATVAPTLIKTLIKALFDEEYGRENGLYRTSTDYFAHRQLEHVVDQLWDAGPPNEDIGDAPLSSDEEVTRTIRRQLHLDSNTFANVMGGVGNRLAYISQDTHLRQIFNNTENRFDFRDLLDEDTVVLFDLGDLRDEAARIMTGVILTNLDAALKDRQKDFDQYPEDYVVNLLVDEAASVVVSDIMNDLLEKGRGFRLSVGLSMQFPEQMEAEGGRKIYLNALNNIGSSLVGKINVDRELARAMAHEEMDPTEFAHRIRSLPRGEWIASLPSPTFGETGPYPFSLEPLPIPPGHPDSDRPLTAAQAERFQDALETIHEHTHEEYGVAGETTVVSRNAATDVTLENADDLPIEVAMARAIRAVQLLDDVRETNGWVSVEDVDEELLSRIDESTIEVQDYETFPEVREASSLIEVNLPAGASAVQCRLTKEGEQAAKAETSTSPTGGGEQHDSVLRTVERALAVAGFSVEVLDQNGESRPDAIAIHPEIDTEVQIEVETTTHVRPAKVLANLRKAQEQERVPLFIVADHDDQPASDIAARISKILSEPYNQLTSGKTRLYTTNHNVTFNGGARDPDGVTAVRPATDESRHTRWFERDGALVLEDSSGEQHARIDSFESVSKDQFPATYSYDAESETYTVFRPGELPETYESREAFEANWAPIKRPFVPDTDLLVPDYTDSSYAIGIITENDQNSDLRLYTPSSDTTKDPTTLVEGIEDGDLHPAGMEIVNPDNEGSVSQDDEEGDPYRIRAFARNLLTESDDEVVAVADVYDAYERYAEAGAYEVKPKSRFTQALREHVEFKRDKKWLDGKTRRCYVGIELRDAGTEGSSDASE